MARILYSVANFTSDTRDVPKFSIVCDITKGNGGVNTTTSLDVPAGRKDSVPVGPKGKRG
jgi:hypothetical protein